jgi:hypothetical protein
MVPLTKATDMSFWRLAVWVRGGPACGGGSFYGFRTRVPSVMAHSRPKKGGDPLRQQGAASCLKTPPEGGGLANERTRATAA